MCINNVIRFVDSLSSKRQIILCELQQMFEGVEEMLKVWQPWM